MSQHIDYQGLLVMAHNMAKARKRQILAIVGAPGSGKSTLADNLHRDIEKSLPGHSVVVPMDGFHYDDVILHARRRRPWKGAPDTFDVAGLRSLYQRLLDPSEGEVAAPVFDRDLEISRGSARLIPASAPLIITEGNYLLIDEAPWPSLRPYFTLTVFIDVCEGELRRRLRQRWEGYDYTEAQITHKLEGNDLPNGRIVIASGHHADWILAASMQD